MVLTNGVSRSLLTAVTYTSAILCVDNMDIYCAMVCVYNK